ncbi:nitroreductase family protein [Lysinimonas soli]|uniref:Putative NAD(P)H nitroreductase n=1 Tax=Lysinimonas soli TaxID=1074233 RepID=A0ABW0NKW7_9MICO
MTSPRGPVAAALRARRSYPAVGDAAPTTRELLPLIASAGSLADHASLRPWRIIAVRGPARERVGAAIAEASGLTGPAAEKLAAKPLRAPLLLAIVFSPKPSIKVPEWEQEAAASGVAHALSLLLDEAGWGVMWRTGLQLRSDAVARAHELAPGERLMGWLYVGAKPDGKSGRREPVKARDHLSSL